MLSNACFLAKFRFDTAENEPAKHFANASAKFAILTNFADRNPLGHSAVSKPGGHVEDDVRSPRTASSFSNKNKNDLLLLVVVGSKKISEFGTHEQPSSSRQPEQFLSF